MLFVTDTYDVLAVGPVEEEEVAQNMVVEQYYLHNKHSKV